MALRCACPPLKPLFRNIHILPCICLCAGFAVNAASQTNPSIQTPFVPDGTVFATSVKKTIHAGKLKPGDAVEFDSAAPTLIGKQTVVPGNAVFHGHVREAVAADANPQRESRLSILVDSVTWKDKTVPVCASIVGFGSRQYRADQASGAQPIDDRRWAMATTAQPAMALQATDTPLDSFVKPKLQSSAESTVTPENIVIGWQAFVSGVEIHTNKNSLTVLTRKKKNIDLPGGLLVGLRQLPNSQGGCPAANTP